MSNIKVLKNILFIIVVVILSSTILIIGVSKLSGVQFLSVISGSMEPEIPVGSMIVTVPTDFEKLKVGDDITFVRDKNLTVVTHRIISTDKELKTVTTQGVANNTPDKPIHNDNIIGKVTYSIPYIGYSLSYVSDTKAKIIVVCGLIAFIIVITILNILIKDKKQKKTIQNFQI